MTSLVSRALAAIAGALLLAITPAANERQTSPRLVPIHVAVTGPEGAVPGLTKNDFEVSIDDKVRTIEQFSAPPSPLSVALLIDVTASMSFYTDLRGEIGKSFAPALLPADRARVGAIGARLVLAPRFSSNRREIIAAGRAAASVRKEDRAGPSPIWDAVDGTLRALENEPGVRGLILVTDGKATGNSVSSISLVQHAVAAGVVVQVLSEARPTVIRQSGTSFARVRSGLLLQELAKQTGGLYVPDDPPASGVLPPAGPLITRFVNDLRAMYTLAVAAEGPGGSAHRVSIVVKRPGLSVRTRRAFLTP